MTHMNRRRGTRESLQGDYAVLMMTQKGINDEGARPRLPSEENLALMTMCGHGMVPGELVDHLVGQMRKGRMSAEEAAMRMTKLCICGVFNPDRAAHLLTAMAQ